MGRFEMKTSAKKICKIIGSLFIAIGVGAFAYVGYVYLTTEDVIDIGGSPIAHQFFQAVHPAPQIIGALALFVGIVLLVAATRKA
jgi:hypothetical protein